MKSNEDDFMLLLDNNIVEKNDVVIITGLQLHGGEHAPNIYGYNGLGFRVYRHDLSEPNKFYNIFLNNIEFQNSYTIIEKIYLSNSDDKLSALILKKTN